MASSTFWRRFFSLVFSSSLWFQTCEADTDTASAIVTGDVHGGSFSGGAKTLLNGRVYDRGYTVNLPDITVVYHDTTGDGQLYVRHYVRKESGNWIDNATIENLNFGTVPDGYTRTYSPSGAMFFVRVQGDPFPEYDAEVSALPEQATGAVTIPLWFRLRDSGGNTQDDVTVTITLNFDVNRTASSANWVASYDEPIVVHLYENGTLPPGGRPLVQDTSGPSFNVNADGTVTNNSDSNQTLSFMADLDQDGQVEQVYELTVLPGETMNVNLGVDLEAGTHGYWIASGEISGIGSPVQAHGESQTFDLAFASDQSPTDVRLVLDNGDLIANEVQVGGQIPQHVVTAPPGVSEVSQTYNGAIAITGGTIQNQATQANGDIHIAVSVPETVASSTVTSTTINQGDTTTIVQMPSGNEVTLGGDVPSNPVTDPVQVSNPGSSTSSGSSDEAAAQLAAIRAEFSAASNVLDSPFTDDGQLEGIAQVETSLATGQEKVGDLIDASGAMTGDFFFLEKDAISAPEIGSRSSYDLTILGTTFTMDFDLPIVAWFRTVVLVAMSVGWFLGLVHFSKL